jgi:HPt (histidine-containing phosphotransfer) domain-containing protein
MAAASTVTDKQRQSRSLFSTAGLVAGILLFTASIFGIALENSAISKKMSDGLQLVNVVGRQRVLLVSMQKDLLQIDQLRRSHADAAPAVQALADAASIFDRTLGALANGGTTQDPSGAEIRLEALPYASERASVRALHEEWQPLSKAVDAVALTGGGPNELREAQAISARSGAALLQHANGFLNDVTESSNKGLAEAAGLRNLLSGLAILCFVLIVFSLYSQVSEGRRRSVAYAAKLESLVSDVSTNARELAAAKAGADTIMQTVRQGLFLITPQFRIESQYSRELESIFRLQELAGYNVLNILQRILTERMFNTSKDFLAMLFDPTKKERTLQRINPLDEVEVNFANPDGGFLSKYLSFSFRRVVSDGQIGHVFIAVSDVTDRVQLERRLRESEQKKERQFELLLGILHVEPRALEDFLATAQGQLREMNDALRAQDFATSSSGQMELLRQRLDTVFRCVHNIKGNASLLKLEYFVKTAEQFESKIAELKIRAALGGDDFLAVVIAQSALRSDVEELQELREKLAGMRGGDPNAPLGADTILGSGGRSRVPELPTFLGEDDLVDAIRSLADSIAVKLGKEVRVEADGFDTRLVPDERRRVIKDVLIQLTRNSVVHGIEEPQARTLAQKPAAGTIIIRRVADTEAGKFRFTFRDDGAGLDPQKIRARSLEQNLLSADQARGFDDSSIVGLIFAPGFTTAEDSTVDAGRGMGMDIIKRRIVDECGGEISIRSDPGRYCEFEFALPVAAMAAL